MKRKHTDSCKADDCSVYCILPKSENIPPKLEFVKGVKILCWLEEEGGADVGLSGVALSDIELSSRLLSKLSWSDSIMTCTYKGKGQKEKSDKITRNSIFYNSNFFLMFFFLKWL